MLAQGNTTDIGHFVPEGDNASAGRIGKGARYRARGQIRLALTGNCYNDYQLQHQLLASVPLALKRSFPHCSISDWNFLPAALLSQPQHSKGMQAF